MSFFLKDFVQIKSTIDGFYVYCYLNNITIKDSTMACPNRVFMISDKNVVKINTLTIGTQYRRMMVLHVNISNIFIIYKIYFQNYDPILDGEMTRIYFGDLFDFWKEMDNNLNKWHIDLENLKKNPHNIAVQSNSSLIDQKQLIEYCVLGFIFFIAIVLIIIVVYLIKKNNFEKNQFHSVN